MSKQYDATKVGQQAQALGGVHTSAGLAALYANSGGGAPVPAGSLAYASDLGPVMFNGSIWQGLASGSTTGTSVGAIGDSIVAHCQPGAGDLSIYGYTGGNWASNSKYYSEQSWLTHGAMRSGNSWYVHEYIAGYGGATSATILSICLPSMMQNPFGLPSVCCILAGTNDVGNSIAVATTISNIKQMAQQLRGVGVLPVICTIPPRFDFPAGCAALNVALVELARQQSLPLADFYGALVKPSNGDWGSANWNDGVGGNPVHPGPQGAAIMGYILNQTLQAWLRPQQRLVTGIYDSTAVYQHPDPNFLNIKSGTTINTTGSYLQVNWNAPSVVGAATLFNSTGSEPGGTHTMAAGVPAISNIGTLPNYQGNAFSLSGDGTTNSISMSSAKVQTSMAASLGDRILFSFRVKWIADQAATNPGQFQFKLYNSNNATSLFGLYFNMSTLTSARAVNVGNEAGYAAGDFYGEYTLLTASDAQFLTGGIFLQGKAGANPTNVNDSVTVSNMHLINMTKAGLLNL